MLFPIFHSQLKCNIYFVALSVFIFFRQLSNPPCILNLSCIISHTKLDNSSHIYWLLIPFELIAKILISKFKDLTTMISKLSTEYTNGATFVMSRDIFYGQVLGMETSSGDAVVVADPQAPAKFNILGYPVIIDDRASGVIFGALKEGYKFNFASDIEVKADDSVAFRTGSTVYRGMCLADGKPSGVGVVRFEQATA